MGPYQSSSSRRAWFPGLKTTSAYGTPVAARSAHSSTAIRRKSSSVANSWQSSM